MSIASTRRVSTSLSYAQPLNGGADVAKKNQSFVEMVDTNNSVSVDDENNAKGSENFFSQSNSNNNNHDENMTNVLADDVDEVTNSVVSSLGMLGVTGVFDTEDVDVSIHQNRSVNIYGNNQAISNKDDDRLSNPYFKYFYENNQVIEDIDELV